MRYYKENQTTYSFYFGISHTTIFLDKVRLYIRNSRDNLIIKDKIIFIYNKIMEKELFFLKLSLACVNAPTISKYLTLFYNTLRLSVATIAIFYSKCALDRINLEISDKISLMRLFSLLLY